MQQSHNKSPKASTELGKKKKKSHHFSEAQVSVLKMERTHPLLGKGATAGPLPPPQSFPARPNQGLPRPRGPLPRDAGPSPAPGGVGAAPSFQVHSPEVTLGEASYCPVAKQKNHGTEGGAPPSPPPGSAGPVLPGAGLLRVHVLPAPGGASQKGRHSPPPPPGGDPAPHPPHPPQPRDGGGGRGHG